MTAKSRAEIRSQIRLRGEYTNVRRFTPEYLNTEIQTAFNRFWGIVEEAHQGWWDTEGTIATVASQAFIALPTDAKVIKGIDRLDGGDYEPLSQIGLEDRHRFGGSGTGKPIAYRLSARGVELYKTPSRAYTLRVFYTPKPPQLTENEQREWFDGWEDFVIEKVLYELDSREGKPMNDRETKLAAAEKALRSSANARRQQEPEYLALRELSDLDPYGDGIL